jgi:hypothetical protein
MPVVLGDDVWISGRAGRSLAGGVVEPFDAPLPAPCPHVRVGGLDDKGGDGRRPVDLGGLVAVCIRWARTHIPAVALSVA